MSNKKGRSADRIKPPAAGAPATARARRSMRTAVEQAPPHPPATTTEEGTPAMTMTSLEAREWIEAQLTLAVNRGQIKHWVRMPGGGAGNPRKWQVKLHPGAAPAQLLPGGPPDTMFIRSYQEGKLICAALASAYAFTSQRRHVDVSDVDGVLAGFVIQEIRVTGPAFRELFCRRCDSVVGDVDDDTEMDTLARMCLDHDHHRQERTGPGL